MADIVIINPRFDISFWGLEHCMPLLGKRANLPVACLGLAGRACARPSRRDADRRECRRHRFRAARPRRHRLPDRHEHSRPTDDRDSRGGEVARRHDGRWRSDGHRRAGSPWKALPTSFSLAKPTRPGRSSCANGSRGCHKRRYEQARKDRHDAACRCRASIC